MITKDKLIALPTTNSQVDPKKPKSRKFNDHYFYYELLSESIFDPQEPDLIYYKIPWSNRKKRNS